MSSQAIRTSAWSTAVTAASLRSPPLREAWGLVADSQAAPIAAADERAALQRIDDTLDVCASGLQELLAASPADRKRCRRGALECAAAVLRAFASIAPPDDSPAAAQLVRTVDDRLVSHENSVLSGEQTYALDLDVVREIPANVGASLSDLDGESSSAAALERLEETAVVLLIAAVRTVANIDTGVVCHTSSPGVSARVLSQLRLIVDEVDRGARGLPETPKVESDRVGKLLNEVLRTGLPKHVVDDLTESKPSSQELREALSAVRSVWLDIGARELEIVRLLDRELPAPSYAHFRSLRQAVVGGAANVLAGGRLLERPGDFLLVNALVHQHNGLAHAVEFYTAGLRGHAPAQTQAQLVVLTRLLRAVAALWVIDARLRRSNTAAPAAR